MTIRNFALLLATLFALSACLSGVAARHDSDLRHIPPHTVLDYYLLLPQKYFAPYPDATRSERLKLLHWRDTNTIDLPNAYLQINGDGAQQSITMCLFKRHDGAYLAAVADNDREVFDPYLHFYAYHKGHLVDVTKSTLPLPYNPKLDYVLPRYGKTIGVFDGTEKRDGWGKRLYNLVWQQERFVLQRVSSKPTSRASLR